MHITLIGASGFAGAAILNEALSRGHQVTALVRHPEKLEARANLSALAVDARDPDALAKATQGSAAIISAYNAGFHNPDITRDYAAATEALIHAAKANGSRVLAVGGAASLEAAPGLKVLDTPDFPEEWKPVARATYAVLERLRQEATLDWTVLSPSAFFEPGPRSGHFRLGQEQLLVDAEGKSHISNADYAAALIDELEQPRHSRQRFTVGY